MAATVSSPWAKPGAWALDAEEHEAELEQQQQHQAKIETQQPLADFPSLSAAVAKPKKKNKGQKVSLAEFSTFGGPKPAEPVGLTHEDRLVLPTGPRERTAEELERNRPGGGFKSYGGDRGNREDLSSKWGNQRREGGGFGGKEGGERDGPSRADEADDWGAGKKSVAGNGFEKRDRGGFFGSQSKADESDSWVSNKSSFSSEGRRYGGSGSGFERERKVGFASNGGGADSESWGRKREESNGGGGFERERKVGLGFNSNGGGADSESWGRKREESNGGMESTGRPRLNLQPRTLPVVSNETSPVAVPVDVAAAPRPRGSNPFGAARPREEVLAEKGQDWKKIDEQLESVKLKEKEAVAAEGESFGKRSFGMGNGRSGDRTVGAWRKPVVAEAEAEAEARPQSAGNDESRSSNSEEPEPENENVNEN
ncbi:putative plant specific eukaryotic initiation factor 4B [Rosa chinensis]|uniref:Putative plant specific eukaryotic initiation factor 4B n=1 Tax=Rosa chinensis TaxID=74649 RepID=A0A2P6PJ29_ROSCH|nr:eukaryotic translation initiation factor 4B3 [Rosa chinensis]PRQ21936.1 putative plant specific eukaryotic initiation factor 4B [Rosa chinensis]